MPVSYSRYGGSPTAMTPSIQVSPSIDVELAALAWHTREIPRIERLPNHNRSGGAFVPRGWAVFDGPLGPSQRPGLRYKDQIILWGDLEDTFRRAPDTFKIEIPYDESKHTFRWLRQPELNYLRAENLRIASMNLHDQAWTSGSAPRRVATQNVSSTLSVIEKADLKDGVLRVFGRTVIKGLTPVLTIIGIAAEAEPANIDAEINSIDLAMERYEPPPPPEDTEGAFETIRRNQYLEEALLDIELARTEPGLIESITDAVTILMDEIAIEEGVHPFEGVSDNRREQAIHGVVQAIFDLDAERVKNGDAGLTLEESVRVIMDYDLANDPDLNPVPSHYQVPGDIDVTPNRFDHDEYLEENHPEHMLEPIPQLQIDSEPSLPEEAALLREAAIATIDNLGWRQSESLIQTILAHPDKFSQFGFDAAYDQAWNQAFDALNPGFQPLDLPAFDAPIGGWDWSAPDIGSLLVA